MKRVVIVFTLVVCGIGVGQETSKQNPNASNSAVQGDLAEADRLETSASARFANRDYKSAIELLKKSLAIREKALGEDHLEVASTLHNLANVYQKAGKPDDAEPLYIRVISIRDRKLGESHDDTVRALIDYACLKKPGKTNEPQRSVFTRRAHCLFFGLAQNCLTSTDSVDDGIVNARVSSWVLPPYPSGAHVTQQILVYVNVSDQGKVLSANAFCGDPLLRKAAVDAALRAGFKPKLVNGRATQFYGILIYDFVNQGR